MHHWLGIFEFSSDIKKTKGINSPNIFFSDWIGNKLNGIFRKHECNLVTQVNHTEIAIKKRKSIKPTTETVPLQFLLFLL